MARRLRLDIGSIRRTLWILLVCVSALNLAMPSNDPDYPVGSQYSALR